MVEPTPPTNPDPAPTPGTPAWVWGVRVLALVAMGISFVLLSAWYAGNGHLPGCGDTPAFSCNDVISTRYGEVAGVPVSGLAVLAYLVLLGATLFVQSGSAPNQRRAWVTLIFLAGGVLGAGVWFAIVQGFVIRRLCPYCMAAHLAGLVVSVMILLHAPIRGEAGTPTEGNGRVSLSGASVVVTFLCGLAGAALVAGGGFLSRPAPAPAVTIRPTATGAVAFDRGTGPQRTIGVATIKPGFNLMLKPADYPLHGSITATHIIVELFDYTCPHCRLLHGELADAYKIYGNQLAVVELPVPLESTCNPRITETEPVHQHACELALLGLAVWRADPAAWRQMDDWLFASEAPRSPAEAREYAAKLLGKDRLAKALGDPWVKDQLGKDVDIYDRMGGGSIPTLLLGTSVIAGQPETAKDLNLLLEEELQVKPLHAASGPATAPAPRPAR